MNQVQADRLRAKSFAPDQDPSTRARALSRAEGWLASHTRLMGWVVFLGSFALFASTRTMYNGGDTRAVVDLAWWVAEGHPPRLNGHPAYLANVDSYGYWAFRTPEGIVSTRYHHGASILFATPWLALLQWLGVQVSRPDYAQYTKLLASLLMAGAAWTMFHALRRPFGSLTALAGAAFFSAASPAYPILSQGLWSQTTGLFCQALSIMLVLPLLPS